MTSPNDRVRDHEFVLVLSGIAVLDERVANAIYEAGCDDATPCLRYGTLSLAFDREATSLRGAILSAIRDVMGAGIDASVRYVDACNLVSQADIARRIGRTRQQVGQYVSGKRGPGNFPGPACSFADGHPLWMWCEVAEWLCGNSIIQEVDLEEARVVAGINSALDLLHQRQHDPGLLDEVFQLVGATTVP